MKKNNKIILEIIASSVQDAINAKKAGANRIELLTSIFLGGLSATPDLVKHVKANVDINIAAMVRPRGGGFNYSELEKNLMFDEAKSLLLSGADAIVFGFLNDNFSIDYISTKKMIDIAHSYNKEAVFHRAIDCVVDYETSLLNLIDLGIDRILTSGQQKNVENALPLIKEIQQKYGDKVQILVGSGITEENVEKILLNTNVKQIHSSCKSYGIDLTSNSNVNVSFDYVGKNLYEINDIEKIKKIVDIVKKIENEE